MLLLCAFDATARTRHYIAAGQSSFSAQKQRVHTVQTVVVLNTSIITRS